MILLVCMLKRKYLSHLSLIFFLCSPTFLFYPDSKTHTMRYQHSMLLCQRCNQTLRKYKFNFSSQIILYSKWFLVRKPELLERYSDMSSQEYSLFVWCYVNFIVNKRRPTHLEHEKCSLSSQSNF